MRRLLRLVFLLATLGAVAYLVAKRPASAPAASPRPASPSTPAKPTTAPVAMKVEPLMAEVGDLDVHGEPELDASTDRSEHVSDTDVVVPAKKAAPAKKKAAAKKAPAKKKAAAKKAAAKKAAAKKAAPPVD